MSKSVFSPASSFAAWARSIGCCKITFPILNLQQPIERAQAARLLAGEKTDLLTQFVSSKTGRQFSAYLVLDDDGKATFEFPPRESGDNAA